MAKSWDFGAEGFHSSLVLAEFCFVVLLNGNLCAIWLSWGSFNDTIGPLPNLYRYEVIFQRGLIGTIQADRSVTPPGFLAALPDIWCVSRHSRDDIWWLGLPIQHLFYGSWRQRWVAGRQDWLWRRQVYQVIVVWDCLGTEGVPYWAHACRSFDMWFSPWYCQLVV